MSLNPRLRRSAIGRSPAEAPSCEARWRAGWRGCSRSAGGPPRGEGGGCSIPGLSAAERDELVRLRRENKQLRLERDILSRAAAWFARETGAVPSGSSTFMKANQAVFPIAVMARVLGVSKAGYYAWLRRPPSARAEADAVLLKPVRTIHAASRQTYGVPQDPCGAAGSHEERHSRKRIARLMHEAGLVGACHRGPGPTTTRRDQEARGRPPIWSTVPSRPTLPTSCG